MQVRATLTALSLFALTAGCASQGEPATPRTRPANPTAAETPAPKASTTLGKPDRDEPVTAPAPTATGAAAPSAPPVAYTCPHHPRVMEAEGGDCPQCGMALEPTTSAQTSPLRERDDNPTIDPQDGADATHEHEDDAGAGEHGGHE